MTTHTATSGQGPVHGGHERPQEPPQSQPGWSFLRSRRWLGYYVLLVIFCIVCVWLADWQFDRRADARAEIARIEQNYDAAAILLDDAVPDPAGFDEDALKW